MTTLLEVQGLTRRFGGLVAVNDLSFSLERGEVLGIIGPNGAGKTTAVNLISGVLKPTTGSVRLSGEDVTALPPHKLAAKGLCRTFQSTTVLPEMTVRDNARRGAYLERKSGPLATFFGTPSARARQRESDERVDGLLERLNLAHLADVRADSLPYGFQKTLGMVIALASNPAVILLDEPVAGLSAEEADHVRDTILSVRDSGVTIAVIDHNMRFIKGLCDRVLVIVQGSNLTSGTPQQVLSDPAVVSAYLGTGHAAAKH